MSFHSLLNETGTTGIETYCHTLSLRDARPIAMPRFHPKTWQSLVLIALLGLCGPTLAASLQVAPTSVELRAGENGAAVWLSNTDPDTPVRAQEIGRAHV